MTMAQPAGAPSRRERARAATLAEIKTTALELMRAQGSTDVRFSDIARAMGLTPPALYRYYTDRAELLTDLIADGYRDLAAALAGAADLADPPPPREHLAAVARAYWDWARRDLYQFTLIFGQPIPGYAAPADGPTVEAATQAMTYLAAVAYVAAQRGQLGPPLVTDVAEVLVAYADEDAKKGVLGAMPAATHQAMLCAWASVHGFVCLDVYGHLDMLGEPVREALFAAQVRQIALTLGM